MKIYRNIVILAVAGALAGCGGDKENQAAHDHDVHQGHLAQQATPAAHESHQAGSETAAASTAQGLVLNGMEKWLMDNHTREMIAKMGARFGQKALTDYPADELKQIGSALRNDINDLIVGCTMEGAAHEELHKFLTRFTVEVDALASSGDIAAAQKVRDSLDEYARFFQ